MNTITVKRVAELRHAIQVGVDAWKRAGEIVVDLIDGHGMTPDQIADECDGISIGVIKQFERIGRRQVLPELLVSDFPACRQIMRLPFTTQAKIMSQGVEYLTADGEKLMLQAREMTALEVRQVFNCGEIRGLSEQKAWIEDEKMNRELSKYTLCESPYRIVGKRVYFNAHVGMTEPELRAVLKLMTKSK